MCQVMRTISREVAFSSDLKEKLTPQRLHAELLAASVSDSRAYLHGAFHDATISHLHRTVRFGQRDVAWLEILRVLLDKVGQKSWMYREGRQRCFWVLETSQRCLLEMATLSPQQAIAYARGYFDAEGGIPKRTSARFYIQLVQKDLPSLSSLREILERAGIRCGKLHVPSAQVAPGLWRFYVRAESYRDFIELVGSWHPRKRSLLTSHLAVNPGW